MGATPFGSKLSSTDISVKFSATLAIIPLSDMKVAALGMARHETK
jgi:hypothetical protein